jgi:hypothetical protein
VVRAWIWAVVKTAMSVVFKLWIWVLVKTEICAGNIPEIMEDMVVLPNREVLYSYNPPG